MFSRKKPVIAASTICLITVTLFLQIGVFANQTQTTGDFTVEAEAYDVFYDCNRDGKVDMVDIFGCILRYGTEGDPVRTSYLSVPPSAFHPTYDELSYVTVSTRLEGAGVFQAEVYLPHGANVTSMAAYLHDSTSTGYVRLWWYRVNIGTGYSIMSAVGTESSQTPGDVMIVDDTIDYPIVNNNGYSYCLLVYLDFESSSLALEGVVITYEYTP